MGEAVGPDRPRPAVKAELRRISKAMIASLPLYQRRGRGRRAGRGLRESAGIGPSGDRPPFRRRFARGAADERNLPYRLFDEQAGALSARRPCQPPIAALRSRRPSLRPATGNPRNPRAEARAAGNPAGGGRLGVVPGLAFDEQGYRLGRGAGYYDRLLPQLRPDATCWAICLRCQLMHALPVEPHDAPLDGIATPDRVVRGIRGRWNP